jgi:uncharacterized membrane protein YdjX (TVP38/TMEM64 family)
VCHQARWRLTRPHFRGVSVPPQGVGPQLRWFRIRQGLALCIVGVALLIVFTTSLGDQLRLLIVDPNPEHLQRWLSTDATWVSLTLIAAMVLHTLVPLPAEILALVAGMALGPWWGFLTIWLGAMLGAWLGFFLARVWGQPLVQRLAAHQRLRRLQLWIQRSDILLLLTVRLLPIFSFNLVNYALGLTTITWWRFTWTTAVGIVPITVLVVVFGAHLHDWRVLLLVSAIAVGICLGGYGLLRHRATALPLASPGSRHIDDERTLRGVDDGRTDDCRTG